ncbi:MAG: hypothetical protein M3P11_10360 [Actinomycetota bacterium]|nr:hypothetical protein [Actinomycetota bacterium]
MKRVLSLFVIASSIASLHVGVAFAGAGPDLAVKRVTSNVASAQTGERVVFKAYAVNLGLGSSELDVQFQDARHLTVIREECIVPRSETGDFSQPSPDTPGCEFSSVPELDYAIVKVVATVTGSAPQKAKLTFCTYNDPVNPGNDCKIGRVQITG